MRNKPIRKKDIEPRVSLVIPAHNEESFIKEKIENMLSLDYPQDKLEIIIASDGSTDETVNIVKGYFRQGVKLFDFPLRRGKPSILNEVIPQAKGEIIIFSDASSILDSLAIRKLVRNFNDSEVGCVCGDYQFGYKDPSLRGKGEGVFVKYELFIKQKEAQLGSVLGLHGALYAMRKELYTKLKEDAINDDYIIPAKIVERGFRSVYEKEAIVYERYKPCLDYEFRRRVRIAAGNWQQLGQLKSLLNPRRGIIFMEFFSHKILRSMTPILLIVIFVVNSFMRYGVYGFMFNTQVLFYLIALMGYVFERKKLYFKFFYAPFYFCMSNMAVAVGLFKFLIGTQGVKWQR